MWRRNEQVRLYETECPNSLPHVLVAVSLCPSSTEAGKLLKAGAIQTRRWDLSDWWSTAKLKDKIPIGVPTMLRLGKRFYSIETVMFPDVGQTIGFWRSFLEGEEEHEAWFIRWWKYIWYSIVHSDIVLKSMKGR